MKKSFFRSIAAAPHILWAALFILCPLLFVVYYAFTDASGAFTINNIVSLKDYTGTFALSVCFALIATVISLLVAYPLAYFITRQSARAQSVLVMLAMLPMWMNLLIRTYSMMAILDNGGFLNKTLEALGLGTLQIIGTPGAVIFGMVYNFFPYMLLPIYSVMSKMDNRLIEAAQDLGCNAFGVLRKVIIPLTRSGIISGITMVFVPSVSTFYISQKLGGNKTMLIGDAIEYLYNLGPSYYNVASALSLILMIMILICLAIMNRFSGDEEDGGVLI